MLTFARQDFVPLEQFGLMWRWTDRRTTMLPADVLRHIRPLSPARAATLAPRAEFLCAPRRDGMRTIAARGDVEHVRLELEDLPVESRARVVVSWSEELAALTDWGTFCRYWDDFCYPGADDLTVWPEDEAWSLCYDHSEQFRFSDHDHPERFERSVGG